MGYSKNYIMYWGFYEYYNSMDCKISLHKVHKIQGKKLYTLYSRFSYFAGRHIRLYNPRSVSSVIFVRTSFRIKLRILSARFFLFREAGLHMTPARLCFLKSFFLPFDTIRQ